MPLAPPVTTATRPARFSIATSRGAQHHRAAAVSQSYDLGL
jgi:hypothetical protein